MALVISYPVSMEVNFTPEQEAQLAQLATKAGINPKQFVEHTVLRLIAADTQVHTPVPELPVWDLGTIGPLHRRDLYDDAI